MKLSTKLKKRDKMSDAMADFWGSSKPIQAQESNYRPTQMMDSMVTPEDMSDEFIENDQSIRGTVERSINTEDGMPMNYMGPQQSNQKEQGNIFDLGGFDAMIQKQMARERGSSKGQGLGMDFGKPQSFGERVSKESILTA